MWWERCEDAADPYCEQMKINQHSFSDWQATEVFYCGGVKHCTIAISPLTPSISLLSIILLFTHHYLGHLFQISLRSSFNILLFTLVLLCLDWLSLHHFFCFPPPTFFFCSPFLASHFWRRSSSALSVGHLKLLADTTLIFLLCNLHCREWDVEVGCSTYTQHTNSPLQSSDVWRNMFALICFH